MTRTKRNPVQSGDIAVLKELETIIFTHIYDKAVIERALYLISELKSPVKEGRFRGENVEPISSNKPAVTDCAKLPGPTSCSSKAVTATQNGSVAREIFTSSDGSPMDPPRTYRESLFGDMTQQALLHWDADGYTKSLANLATADVDVESRGCSTQPEIESIQTTYHIPEIESIQPPPEQDVTISYLQNYDEEEEEDVIIDTIVLPPSTTKRRGDKEKRRASLKCMEFLEGIIGSSRKPPRRQIEVEKETEKEVENEVEVEVEEAGSSSSKGVEESLAPTGVVGSKIGSGRTPGSKQQALHPHVAEEGEEYILVSTDVEIYISQIVFVN
jgi:hypothetical protein